MELKKLTVNQIKRGLSMNAYHSTKRSISAAAVVADPLYTIDGRNIVVFAVIKPVRGKSSIQFSERFHSHFRSESEWPQYAGKPVDIQFLYPGESTPVQSEALPVK